MSASFSPATAAKVARMLLVLAVFGQIIFMVVADFVYQGMVTIQVPFGITYLMCSLLQVRKPNLYYNLSIYYISIEDEEALGFQSQSIEATSRKQI